MLRRCRSRYAKRRLRTGMLSVPCDYGHLPTHRVHSPPDWRTNAIGWSLPGAIGDWGKVDSGGKNAEQSDLMRQIARSGVTFAVTTGDTAYPSGSQTNYGDLVQRGADMSTIFGPALWTKAGDHIPLFNVQGNHGMNATSLLNWPDDRAAVASSGRYRMQTYCCANGTSSASYPSSWYAFNAGPARFYVLEASWANSNVGNGDIYKNDHDAHWRVLRAEYRWLGTILRRTLGHSRSRSSISRCTPTTRTKRPTPTCTGPATSSTCSDRTAWTSCSTGTPTSTSATAGRLRECPSVTSPVVVVRTSSRSAAAVPSTGTRSDGPTRQAPRQRMRNGAASVINRPSVPLPAGQGERHESDGPTHERRRTPVRRAGLSIQLTRRRRWADSGAVDERHLRDVDHDRTASFDRRFDRMSDPPERAEGASWIDPSLGQV